MKKYKGYYIDQINFKNENEIDDFVKENEIRKYKNACRMFAEQGTMEISAYVDMLAQRLNKVYQIAWSDLEQIEIEAYESGI